MSNIKYVYMIQKGEKTNFWTKIGVAFVNKDGVSPDLLKGGRALFVLLHYNSFKFYSCSVSINFSKDGLSSGKRSQDFLRLLDIKNLHFVGRF